MTASPPPPPDAPSPASAAPGLPSPAPVPGAETPPGAPPAPPAGATPAAPVAPAASSAAPPAAAPAPTAHWNPPVQHPFITIALIFVVLLMVLLILRLWHIGPFVGSDQSTDNSYVRGRTTVIAPQVSGYVVEVAVHDYDQVQTGQVLVRIDDRIYRARVEQAQASLRAQQTNLDNYQQSLGAKRAALKGQQATQGNSGAQLTRAQADIKRADELVRDGSISVRERDQTLAALRQAESADRQTAANVDIARQDLRTTEVNREGLEAQVAAALAQLHSAQVDLDNTVIRAVEPGRLSEVGVRLGQYVTNGTTLFSMVPGDRWVIANFKEAQTHHMQPGQRATISVDALGGATVRGHIERMAPAAGSEFSAIRPDNAVGNFVKIPQRIGVRIALEPDDPLFPRLSPGMSVEVTIDTRTPP